MRRYIRGELPGFPISRLVGMRPTEAGFGKATFTMPITRWLEDGFGLYWGGVYALFADAPLAGAIWTTLPAGKSIATSELSLSFVRPMSRATTHMVGRAETIHAGREVGLSTVQITDHEGRMLAFGSTRCLISDLPVDPAADYPAPNLGPAGPAEPPDPYLRPPPDGFYFSREEILEGVPSELQRTTLEEGRAFPVWKLTGYRAAWIADGCVESTLPASPWLSNGGPAIYGGALAWAAEFTMGASVYSTLGAGDVFATLDMHIRFIRPARVGSGPLKLSATVRHRGKRLRVTACNVDDADGRRVAMATSSVLVVPGGVRELAKGRLPAEIVGAASAEP
jgi:uncharacterized protein (TIGR00369 family)